MVFLKLSNFHILFVFGILLYVFGILIFNANRGLELTDESFYILNAIYPFDVFSVITHESYYTGLLFYLSGYNLAIFRVFGIIVLLTSSIWFALELYRYIEEKFELNYNIYNKLYFILIISFSSLSYYTWWLITPSYNWLSLVAMLLIISSMFRIINNNDKIKDKLFVLEYFYLGFSLSLLFMAKPTSLLGLFPIFVLFIVFNYEKICLIKGFISVSTIYFTLITLHIIFLDGGFSNYIHRFNESIERISLLGGNHGIINSFYALYDEGLNLYMQINKIDLIIFVLFSLFVTRYFYNNKFFLLILSYIFISYITYLFYFQSIIPFSIGEKFYVTILIFSFYIFMIYIFNEQKLGKFFNIYIKTFLLYIFLSYLSIAVSFGTNNNIWFHSNISYIFPVAGIISLVFILDKYHSMIKNLKIIVGIVISLSIYVIIDNAYENPYRLNTSIKEQTEKIGILGGISVDKKQKIFINDLLRVKEFMNSQEDIYLIDTTGITPGANLIIGAKFFEQSWLLGGFKGSEEIAYRILNNVSEENLKSAWILTAPTGIRTLDLNVFSKLDLEFPDNYDKIITLFLESRNEIQELWKPKETFNDK